MGEGIFLLFHFSLIHFCPLNRLKQYIRVYFATVAKIMAHVKLTFVALRCLRYRY